MRKALRPIHTARAHKAALAEIDALLTAAKLTRVQEERLELLGILANDYEDRAFPMDERDPVDLLEGHMQNGGRTQKDLAALVGSALASLILSRQRALSLEAIRKISAAWGIPADLLIKPYALTAKRA